MRKQVYPIILIIVFMFSFFSACNGDLGEGNSENKESVKTYTESQGYDFIFIVAKNSVNAPELAPEVGFSNLGDKILQRYEETEEAFNCTMTVEVADGKNNNILASNMAGNKCAD